MFQTLLIANRGEIARRIIRTARRMGLRTVAVHSDADAAAAHVAEADEALRIGPPPAGESYLKIEAILEAARRSGAEAIHPGYGFLSENAAFAEACEAAGLIFVGPPPEAIRAMGSKSEGKALMEKAGVPLVPGYHGEEQAETRLAAAAEEVGYPVLVKASAGGGGKGMRLVEAPGDFPTALAAAKREAKAAFGDERMLVEKYLTRPRHIEIQVFADSQGNAVHLFERDCSIQRRHQKVLEEAPAPGLEPAQREAMGAAAVAAAKAIGYRGAGTVEFVAQDGAFYFIEMNTRLQVEHPVTEMITGRDLVEWQLRIAAGEPLPARQEEIRLQGHAIEARLYAEDPARDFLPAAGRLAHLAFPESLPGLRVDSAVRSGDLVSTHYDPMIAKVIAQGATREEALRRLIAGLTGTEVAGVTTNLAFLRRVLAEPDYAAGALDTGFIERHRDSLFAPEPSAGPEVLALAALAELLRRAAEAAEAGRRSSDPWSPWNRCDGWRLNSATHSNFCFAEGDSEQLVRLHFEPAGYRVEVEDAKLSALAPSLKGDRLEATLEGRRRRAVVLREGQELLLILEGRSHRLTIADPLTVAEAETAGAGRLAAPMPGKVVQVLVEAGVEVTRGQPLILLEAMKMEHTIKAPADGVVEAVHFSAGDSVEEGVELMAFAPRES